MEHFIKHNNKYIKSPLNKVLLNRSRFLASFVSLIQYQTDLFTCSPLTKDCSTRIYSESMGVYRGQCILLITSKNSIWPLNLNLKKSRVWITILRKIFKKEKLCRKKWDNIGIKFRGGTLPAEMFGGVPVLWSKWPLASSLLQAIKTCPQACPPSYLLHFS